MSSEKLSGWEVGTYIFQPGEGAPMENVRVKTEPAGATFICIKNIHYTVHINGVRT